MLEIVEMRITQLAASNGICWSQRSLLRKRNGKRRFKNFRGKKFEGSDNVPNTLIESFPVSKNRLICNATPSVINGS